MVMLPEFILPERISAYLVYRKGTHPEEAVDDRLSFTVRLIELKNNTDRVIIKFDTCGDTLPLGMRHGTYEVAFGWEDGLRSDTLPEDMFANAIVPRALLKKLGLK